MAGHSSWFITEVGSSIQHTCRYSGMLSHDVAHLYVPLVWPSLKLYFAFSLLCSSISLVCALLPLHAHSSIPSLPTSILVPTLGWFPFPHLSLMMTAGKGSLFQPGIALPSPSLEDSLSWFMFDSKPTSTGRDKHWPGSDRTPSSASPSLCLPQNTALLKI